jgi:hypothetical protein
MGVESREHVLWCGWGLGSRSGLGQYGNIAEGQGIIEDITFCNSDHGYE